MNVNLCIPVLKRYDLLIKCLESAEAGTLKPERYFIIDNGNNLNLESFDKLYTNKVFVVKVRHNLGVARSWNWFFDNVPDEIVLCNDDIEFYDDSLEKLMSGYDENFSIYPSEGSTSFSLMAFPRKIINDVGHFDESLSPYYAYFEDNDYHYRMLLKGYTIKDVPGCRVKHENSGTMKMYTPTEMNMHHQKFREARARYLDKWVGEPVKEKFKIPYNGVLQDGTTRKDNTG
jgi:GT2 family glycosyltransferase